MNHRVRERIVKYELVELVELVLKKWSKNDQSAGGHHLDPGRSTAGAVRRRIGAGRMPGTISRVTADHRIAASEIAPGAVIAAGPRSMSNSELLKEIAHGWW